MFNWWKKRKQKRLVDIMRRQQTEIAEYYSLENRVKRAEAEFWPETAQKELK